MAKEGAKKDIDVFELLEKTGGKISIAVTGEPSMVKVDLTKLRYLANFSQRSIILGDLALTLFPGDVVDLYKLFKEEQIINSRSLKDALIRDVPLLHGYEDSETAKEQLKKDIAEFSLEPTPLEKMKEAFPTTSSEGITQPEGVVIPDKDNPYQEELEKVIDESERGYVIGEPSKAAEAKRGRKKKE